MASSGRKNVLPIAANSQRSATSFKIPHLRFEVRLVWLLLLLVAPTLALGEVVLYLLHVSGTMQLCILGILILFLLFLASTVFRHIVSPLQTLSNVVAALRENE